MRTNNFLLLAPAVGIEPTLPYLPITRNLHLSGRNVRITRGKEATNKESNLLSYATTSSSVGDIESGAGILRK